MARLLKQLLDREIPREGEGTGGAAGGGAGAGAGNAGKGSGEGGNGGGAGAAGDAGKAGGDGGAGAGGDPWYKALGVDEATATWIEGHKFADAGALIKTAMHFEERARSRNVLPAPDPEKIGEWEGWEKLGWEKDPAKYTFEEVKDLPPGMEWPAAIDDKLRQLAHEKRVPLNVARDIRAAMIEENKRQFEELTGRGAKAEKDLETALRTEWGADYDRNRETARRAAQALGVGEADSGQLEEIVGSPGLMKLFHKAGELIGEQALPPAGQGGDGLPSTVAGVRAELNRLAADETFMKALRDPRHPQHGEVTAKRQRLIDRMAKLEGAGT